MKIAKITVEHIEDTDPDLSCIGRYTEVPTPEAMYTVSGEFLCRVEKAKKIISALDDIIYDEDEKDVYISMCEKRRGRIQEFIDDVTRTEHNILTFFIPYAGGETVESEDFPQYANQDYATMHRVHNGDLYFIGINVTADIEINYGVNSTAVDTVTTSLWGIESGNELYINQCEQDLIEELRKELSDKGFLPGEINTAISERAKLWSTL